MVEHESFDGNRYDDMPQTVDELLTAAAEDEVEAVTMHELSRCHELEGPCSIAPSRAAPEGPAVPLRRPETGLLDERHSAAYRRPWSELDAVDVSVPLVQTPWNERRPAWWQFVRELVVMN